MKRKHKMTGCARFFIALLIIAPLAYVGASYYNGQNPIENIKNFFGSREDRQQEDRPRDTRDSEIKKLKDENDALRKENDQLRKQVKDLQESTGR